MTWRISPVAVCCSKASVSAVAFLQFFEQPHILDRDDSLVGKGLEQSYLLFGEGKDFRSADYNSSNGDALSKQRRREHCARAT